MSFDTFWRAYPRKVGKLAAMAAYTKALTLASAEEILAGLERYRQHLPDEAIYIVHPRTWLHQGRWLDEYEDAKPKPVQLRGVDRYREDPTWDGSECPHATKCIARFICQSMQSAERREAS